MNLKICHPSLGLSAAMISNSMSTYGIWVLALTKADRQPGRAKHTPCCPAADRTPRRARPLLGLGKAASGGTPLTGRVMRSCDSFEKHTICGTGRGCAQIARIGCPHIRIRRAHTKFSKNRTRAYSNKFGVLRGEGAWRSGIEVRHGRKEASLRWNSLNGSRD